MSPVAVTKVEPKNLAKESRDSSRKRKSQSPQGSSHENKKQKRKAARQAQSRIEMLPKGLIPKTPQPKEPSQPSSSDEDPDSNINLLGRKQKSILQPSGGKSSKKAMSRGKELFHLQQADGSRDNEDNDDEQEAESDASPITMLRNAGGLETSTKPARQNSSQDESPSPKVLPRQYLELKVVEYELPSTEPQGPGDLWTCTFEGCFYRVHEASTREGKTKIVQHFKSHANQAQEKIDLVLDESRPYLPVR